MNDNAVEARGISFAYGEREALRSVDFDVARGTAHGFLGPNGSGKSTLFKLLATILPLKRGRATVLGLDLATQVAQLRAKLGVVFQSPALDKKLSVRSNLAYAGMLFGLGGRELAARVDEMLEVAGLRERARDTVGELSGGLRRRVELAKGMLHRPELLLLDEPSTGLDPRARRELWDFLRARKGVTVLFTTHLMDEAEEASQITLLDQGRVVAAGTPKELIASVGGEVLEIGTPDPKALAVELQRHGAVARVVGDVLRIEHTDAPSLVPALMQRHGAFIQRVTLSRPSLADVFLAKTGRRLDATAAEEGT